MIEGIPNQLYSLAAVGRGKYILCHRQQEESRGGNGRRDHGSFFLIINYALWLDFRTSDGDSPNDSGRRIEYISERVTIHITKTV